MAKSLGYECRTCGAESPTWTGNCRACGGWATIEQRASGEKKLSHSRPLAELANDQAIPVPTGIEEFDRVLGGGLVPASTSLLSGEPGIGKSTLTLQVAMSVAASGASVLLVAGEEAPGQIASRAARVGDIPHTLRVLEAASVEALVKVVSEDQPQLVIVDSVQTVATSLVDSAAGSVSQVKACTAQLVAAAKAMGPSILLVGHVTKDGGIAGPRVLEHMVDTVISFDGDRHGQHRLLRTLKHRFGPTGHVGVFEMTTGGLRTVADPSTRFLGDRAKGLSGSVVVPVLEGQQPVLVEVQALVTDALGPVGLRRTVGVDGGRVGMLLAVLEQRAGISAARLDVYVSVAGGGHLDEPAADLGVALVVASAILERPVPNDVVLCGEIGLGGEVRSVPRLDHRLQEAYLRGFRRAIVPTSSDDGPAGLSLVRASTLAQALDSNSVGSSANYSYS